jgi:CRISPR-associated endonuclease/helicase Cas3
MTKQKLFIELESKSIAACNSLPLELAFMGKVLQHQVDVYQQSKDCDIILDLAPTGTGKTDAGLSVLLHQPDKHAVYIAPTNALITQQTEAAEKFIIKANLPHVVKSASAKEIKAWSNNRVGKRSGEKLYNLLRNPATIFPEVGEKKPLLLVTNPDIFYYATFFGYNRLDRTNIAASFLTAFNTIIFDEFHLYDAKQLVSLLFYLAYSHVFKFFENNRKIVLLTATPEPACEKALEALESKGVKIARIDGENNDSNLIPSQTAVSLEIRAELERDKLLIEIANEVKHNLQTLSDSNGVVILDSKDRINRLSDLLKAKGLENKIGRITGSTTQSDRAMAAEKQVILATSTVDVGFNFKKTPEPFRQNLDWLIFSTKDRFSFWQRIGRVGRVLGKAETNIPSQAIVYLPEKAWDENITSLDTSGGRESLKETLNNLACLNRPFLDIYWRSEAFLEIARPLLEIESLLDNLPATKSIEELYETMRSLLGGKHNWNYYRYRIKTLKGAENIAKTPAKELKKQWKYIKGGQAFVKTFIKVDSPEDFEFLESGKYSIEQYEQFFQDNLTQAERLKQFAKIYSASYAPLFQFRDSLFENVKIYDPKGFLLDESEKTILDPIHLLRYYEFDRDRDRIEIIDRAKETYQLEFSLRFIGTAEEFKNTKLNQLTAWENCYITRKLGNAIAPTALLSEIEKQLIPGVIISAISNQGIIIQLRKQGIASFPITVSCNDFEKQYNFFPSLSGILAIAMCGRSLKLPDGEDFYII